MDMNIIILHDFILIRGEQLARALKMLFPFENG